MRFYAIRLKKNARIQSRPPDSLNTIMHRLIGLYGNPFMKHWISVVI